MNEYSVQFNKLLLEENRYECINYVKGLLDSKKVNVVDLYEKILGPSMLVVGQMVMEEEVKIWQEHVYASILRSVVENCYPYVVDSSKENDTTKNSQKKVLIMCPSDEYHEIGPRMVADFFTILGFKTTYIGGNTPKGDFVLAIKNVRPDVVAISVSNYYNIVTAKDTIDLLKTLVDFKFKIIVGGGAFERDSEAFKQIGADYKAKTFEEIKKIGSEI